MQYEYVKRSSKRKRDDEEISGSDDEPGNKKRRFNTMARCSLKELPNCIKLLQERHLVVLSSGGLGHLKDFKIKCNINTTRKTATRSAPVFAIHSACPRAADTTPLVIRYP
jgi:hypothetical protein